MTSNVDFDAEAIRSNFIKRLVHSLLDVILLAHFEQDPFSGYDATQYLHRDLNVLISPGTVYSTLYSMERHGLLESSGGTNKTLFKATAKGIYAKNL